MAPAITSWADGPLALISSTGAGQNKAIPTGHAVIFFAQEMAQVHNTILRAFNASYNQCLDVRPGTQEATDFLIYNQCIFELLHEHHSAEEEIFFPEIDQLAGDEGLMDHNRDQHKELDEGLELFRAYAYNTSSDEYDGQELRNIMDEFGSTLEKHLHGEIPTLLTLSDLDSEKLMKIWARAEHAVTDNADPYRNAPITLGCQDKTFLLDGAVREFPPGPFFVPHIVHYVYSGRYSGSWKFNPCDFFKTPRPLHSWCEEKPSQRRGLGFEYLAA